MPAEGDEETRTISTAIAAAGVGATGVIYTLANQKQNKKTLLMVL